jgi:pseudouridine synthase
MRPQAKTARSSNTKPVLKTLDRVLSKAGLCSRTDARQWIAAGRLRVNDKVVRSPEHWVDIDRDRVLLDGKPLRRAQSRYILLYKPRGYLTTYRDPQGRRTVYDLLPGVDQFVAQVGRLDLETSGLLLLTNDSQLAEALTNPDQHVPKKYLVKAQGALTSEQITRLRDGVELDDGPTSPAKVQQIRTSERYTSLELTISEGRNRQVRRMLEAIGSKVVKLVRTQLGPLTLEGLSIGKWRELTAKEVQSLKRLSGPKQRVPKRPVE